MEVDQRQRGNLRLQVAPSLGLLQALDRVVVAVDVGLVVLAVVQLHDLAGDGGLEGAIVVWFEAAELSVSEMIDSLGQSGFGRVQWKAYMKGRAAWLCRV